MYFFKIIFCYFNCIFHLAVGIARKSGNRYLRYFCLNYIEYFENYFNQCCGSGFEKPDPDRTRICPFNFKQKKQKKF